ncbi:MAG: hypothetical protein C4326_05720 [Ignavibacteria bacterium]
MATSKRDTKQCWTAKGLSMLKMWYSRIPTAQPGEGWRNKRGSVKNGLLRRFQLLSLARAEMLEDRFHVRLNAQADQSNQPIPR